jgi:hypothetical protein
MNESSHESHEDLSSQRKAQEHLRQEDNRKKGTLMRREILFFIQAESVLFLNDRISSKYAPLRYAS